MCALFLRPLKKCTNDVRIFSARFKSSVKFQKSAASITYNNHGHQSIQISEGIVLPNDLTTQTLKGISFDDYKECFGSKSTWEVVRALFVLQLCSVEKIAENSLELMRWTQNIVGVRGLRLLFKPTFYNQFVGGETTEELRACTQKLAQTGMRTMLAATMEEDVGEGGNETVYNNNCRRILDAIEIVTTENIKSPMIQLKLSGLLSADLLVTIGNLYGESSDKIKLVKALAQGLEEGKINQIPFTNILDEKKIGALERSLERLRKISIEAKQKGVKVLVDAEHTYMNDGLSLLALAAVAAFNRDASVIWNTYQCYLKESKERVMEELNMVVDVGCHFGAKLVRGAYMMQERNRARKLQIPDPICDNYAATCDNYNKILSFLLEKHSVMGPQCQFIVASHNEESIKFAVKKMEDLNLEKGAGGVCFGQLYGMCDQVSNPLMKVGLPVYKSIPYGTIDQVLPYLARRAVENTSVLEGARKELSLLKKELKRRMWKK